MPRCGSRGIGGVQAKPEEVHQLIDTQLTLRIYSCHKSHAPLWYSFLCYIGMLVEIHCGYNVNFRHVWWIAPLGGVRAVVQKINMNGIDSV